MDYFISFGSIQTGIRIKKSLISNSDNFTLFIFKPQELNDINIQTLVIRVTTDNLFKAQIEAFCEKGRIAPPT